MELRRVLLRSVGMRSCYDESKRFAEMLTTTFRRQHDLDVRIVRIFNTYGPRSDQEDERLIPNFVTQALTGRPITVYGDGTQTRSLCYVSDMVEGIVRAMYRDGASSVIFNLGNPEEHTVREDAGLGASGRLAERTHFDHSVVSPQIGHGRLMRILVGQPAPLPDYRRWPGRRAA